MPNVDTGKIADRRTLHFHSPQEVLNDAERIMSASRSGALRASGNWTPGQIFGHLATWINMPYDGYPPDMKPPWIIKFILRRMKRRFFTGPMKAGVRIPKVENGTLGVEVLPTEEGYARFVKAWNRLKAGPPAVPNIIFGPLSHDEWITMHLRHAELHLSFLHP